jgi:hypothetical protein
VLFNEASAQLVVNDVLGLQNINNNLSGNYVLGNDIDATGWAFTPIGNAFNAFTGTFDGGGHTIKGLNIDSSDLYTGIFESIGNIGVVENLSLTNLSVTGNASQLVGGLVGLNKGTIQNVTLSGSISAKNGFQLGGLAGNNDGTVVRSGITGSVSGGVDGVSGSAPMKVGGLLGQNNGSVDKSYAKVELTETNGVSGQGGIMVVGGFASGNTGSITNSYATGSVRLSASDPDIAIAGGFLGNNTGNLSSVFAADSVSITPGGSRSFTGGLLGSPGPGSITSAYWDIDATGQTTGNGGTALTTLQLKSGTLPTGFDPSVWTATAGQYPKLIGVADQQNSSLAASILSDSVKWSTGSDYASFRNQEPLAALPPRTNGTGGVFTPNGYSLDGAAQVLGYDHFNWLQIVTLADYLTDGSIPLSDLSGLRDQFGNLPSVPFIDPPAGGYSYQVDRAQRTDPTANFPVADNLPWYLDEKYNVDNVQPTNPFITSDYDRKTQLGFVTISNSSGIGTKLLFTDSPSAPAGQVEFLTALVGVREDGSGDILDFPTTVFRWAANSEILGTVPILNDIIGLGNDATTTSFLGFVGPTDFTLAELDYFKSAGINIVTPTSSVPEPSSLAGLGMFLLLAMLMTFLPVGRRTLKA